MGDPNTTIIWFKDGTTSTISPPTGLAVSTVGLAIVSEQTSRRIGWDQIERMETFDEHGDLVAWYPPG